MDELFPSGPSSEPSSDIGSGPSDAELLDAYSHAVVAVVAGVGGAVVNIASGDVRGRRGAGSGVMVAPDCYLLTNNHVVERAESLSVSFTDGVEMDADLVGRDPPTDLAVLRARGNGLPYAELGDSSRLQVGQLVIAIGNPLGFSSSVSTGVVSALGRSLDSRNGRLIEGVIQHTAPLNPGNSGGGLLDSHGRVMGINTAIIASAQNLGFAIPVDTARWVLTQLLTKGRVLRGFLGIAGRERPLDRHLVRHLGLATEKGVEIAHMEQDGAADEAGLRSGDIVLGIAGRPVQDIPDLQRVLGEIPVGEPAVIEILRRTKVERLTVIPTEAPN
ncbi:MAG TPA: trypsin-like peptidase domain-containing protein [Gammaproteobacteria bacterium]|nr:trypsin-like peptidase domain-containing protein [Gammaproteobacteria bacterium]